MTAGERRECPACGSVTVEIANEFEAGRPCPSCWLPFEEVDVVQRARSGLLDETTVEHLIAYARATAKQASRIVGLEVDVQEYKQLLAAEKRRAEVTLADLRRLQETTDGVISALTGDLKVAQWRLSRVRSGLADALDGPAPRWI